MREKIETSWLPLRWPLARVPRPVLLGGVAAALSVAAGSVAWYTLSQTTPAVETATTADIPAAGSPSVVELPPGKRQIADIHSTALAMQELHDVRRVPGRIGYNTSRRISVKLPVGGVLKNVLVQQGQNVKRGDTLAVLTSTEVGMARTEVVSAEANVELARKESQWADEIAANVDALRKLLKDEPEMKVVEREFGDRLLGPHRESVLPAYSKLLVARKIAESTDSVVATGGVSGIIAEERHSSREVAAAQFKSALEQSLFDSSQQRIRADAALERAQRVLSVTNQKLDLLLGQFAEVSPTQQDDTICELILRSPIDGVVEERLVTDDVHFDASQVLFTITNTDMLRVSAHIYDREWALLNDSNVKEVMVEAPAVPDHLVQARVLFTAVTTSAESGAVPLVAEFTNVDGHFKPGMFAWVSIPVSTPQQVLVVPLSAVTRHEEKAFVFVEEKPGTYRRVDVDLGRTAGDFVEIRHGLTPGQKVVDRGVFTLKSELLLGEVES